MLPTAKLPSAHHQNGASMQTILWGAAAAALLCATTALYFYTDLSAQVLRLLSLCA